MTHCTIENALRLAVAQLTDSSPTPELDSQLLLSFVTDKDRLRLVMDSKEQLTINQLEKFNYFVTRRLNSEPVAYITGKKEFWGLDFEVNASVLIPRPETEGILENFLTLADDMPDPLLLCDLGTGSGCIAVAAAFELKRRSRNFFVLAIDRSLEALKVARRNAEIHGVSEYVHFACCSWASAIKISELISDNGFDFVLSNPPYLDQDEPEISPELKYEPASALYSGPQGVDDYLQILQQLPRLLNSRGYFLGEFGYGQLPLLSGLVNQELPEAQFRWHPDIRKIPRILEISL